MSKFAIMVALMLVTGYDAWALYTFPSADPHFITAAYLSGAVAAILVYLEAVHLIFRGFQTMVENRRQKKAIRQAAGARMAKLNQAEQPLPDTSSSSRLLKPRIQPDVAQDEAVPPNPV